LVVTRSKGRNTFGQPFRLRLEGLTPAGYARVASSQAL
jgi:hypothetical protein